MAINVDLIDIMSGFLTAEAHNVNNSLIEEALGKALNREGGADNDMKADLDMGMNNIFNLKAAVLNNQAVPLKQVRDLLGASSEEVTSLIEMEDRFTAAGGETVIEFENIKYTPATNSLMVFKDGVYQRASLEYLETADNAIEFITPLQAGEVVDVFGSRYDAQQYVDLAITAASNAEAYRDTASQYATDAQSSADTAIQAAGYKLDVNNQTGTAYTLSLADAGDFIRMDNPAENTVTVPTHSSEPFELGTVILVRQVGDGVTTISPGLGVTVNAPYNEYKISANDFGIALVKVADNEWDMIKAFGGVDTSDLVAFSAEFDARMDDFYREILSASPTFVVNFDSLQTMVENEVASLNSEFNTLQDNVTTTADNLTADFAVMSDDFSQIESNFAGIQQDFSTIQQDFTTIQQDFDSIQQDFTGFQTLIEDTNTKLDSIDLDGMFENDLAVNGYQKLSGGLVIQWGLATISGGLPSAPNVVTFPTPFPNACLNVQVTYGARGDQDGDNLWAYELNSNTFIIRQNGTRADKAYWFAIGY